MASESLFFRAKFPHCRSSCISSCQVLSSSHFLFAWQIVSGKGTDDGVPLGALDNYFEGRGRTRLDIEKKRWGHDLTIKFGPFEKMFLGHLFLGPISD